VFTGIIEEVGAVVEARDGLLKIRVSEIDADSKLGDSIAINGVDLTIMEIGEGVMAFNVMPETYRRSNLVKLQAGDRVNLERSVRPTDRLSGHIVRGVVETTCHIVEMTPEAEAMIVRFEAPSEYLEYIVVKGPVCLDGASLTVIDKTKTTFAVSLVQYTQEHTNILQRQVGDIVNLETDILARYVGELLAARAADD
jgi:riboflavin synthase